MNSMTPHFTHLPDVELLATVETLRGRERELTSEMIAALVEVERRGLHLSQGFPSLYVYCTSRLGFSEHEAYCRIHAARAARSYPVIIERLCDGRLSLTAVTLVAPYLTHDNHLQLLDAAAFKTKREILELLAARYPQPAVPSSVWRVPVGPSPARAQSEEHAGASQPDTGVDEGGSYELAEALAVFQQSQVEPLGPNRYKLQVTISQEAHEILRRIQALIRHVNPSADPAPIVERGLQLLLADLERRRTAQTERPHRVTACRSGTRYVPAHVRRAVWRRDGGRCAFIGSSGRCPERSLLEFHHVVPYAEGGATTIANLELRCRSHNVFEVELRDTG